ncbi:hypothetical protein HZ994_07950 [Akkermansiaceae bacterium]|nr:hypothetical protein HZ994_07950 [Akkermansiaceae bacterium]
MQASVVGCAFLEDFLGEVRSAEVLDKILRYETKLERQLYRAMAQLERVQRIRNGEAVPAPLAIQF